MRKFLFADEAGDFDFSRKQHASRYFICCAVCFESSGILLDLLRLRRQLMWDNVELADGYFHATKDSQTVRNEVFSVLGRHDFKIYAQIMEKAKAQPQIRVTHERFYKYGWYYLFRHTMPNLVQAGVDQLMVTTASIGTKKGQSAFSEAVKDTVNQAVRLHPDDWRVAFCPSSTDLGLQAADYCTWAIQRKWERGDTRSYDLIKGKIAYEYDLWSRGTTLHY